MGLGRGEKPPAKLHCLTDRRCGATEVYPDLAGPTPNDFGAEVRLLVNCCFSASTNVRTRGVQAGWRVRIRPRSASSFGTKIRRPRSRRKSPPKSLSENCVGSCGEGFWLWPRRRGRSIPAAGCDDRANAGHGQKTRRPEGFRGKGRLAALLLGQRPLRVSSLVAPCHPAFPAKTGRPRNFQTGSKARRGWQRVACDIPWP